LDNDVKSWIIRVKDKKDDYEAWGRLYLRYKGFLISIIRRYVFDLDLQQDMIQEIWLKVFRNIKSYDENRYFEAWLHVVARNVCISWPSSINSLMG
jgi:RNA polymerase sigma-70 factor (ECF subfamily)